MGATYRCAQLVDMLLAHGIAPRGICARTRREAQRTRTERRTHIVLRRVRVGGQIGRLVANVCQGFTKPSLLLQGVIGVP